MGSVFPTIADLLATTTAGIASLGQYLVLPLLAIPFVVTVVIVAIVFFRRWVLKAIRGAASMGGRRGRGRRR